MNQMKQTTNPGNNPVNGFLPDAATRHERIAKRAYYLWLANGSRHGEHLRYWLEAESEELKAIRPDPEHPSTARRARQIGKPRSAPVSHEAVLNK
jgi:hypothetical protein